MHIAQGMRYRLRTPLKQFQYEVSMQNLQQTTPVVINILKLFQKDLIAFTSPCERSVAKATTCNKSGEKKTLLFCLKIVINDILEFILIEIRHVTLKLLIKPMKKQKHNFCMLEIMFCYLDEHLNSN